MQPSTLSLVGSLPQDWEVQIKYLLALTKIPVIPRGLPGTIPAGVEVRGDGERVSDFGTSLSPLTPKDRAYLRPRPRSEMRNVPLAHA